MADNRLFKEVGNSYTANDGEKFIYIRDGSGTPLAVYKQQVEEGHEEYRMTYLLEHSIYGSKRLGNIDYGASRLVQIKTKNN